MSLTLIEDIKKNLYGKTYRNSINTFGFQWGKAAFVPDHPSQVMMVQGPVTCKDYVVDTMFKDASLCIRANWTPEQLNDPLVYIVVENTMVGTFLTNGVTFLNDYEKYHRLIKTKVTKIDSTIWDLQEQTVFLVHFSKMWMKTVAALSTYLSILRMCIHVKKPTDIKFKPVNHMLRHNTYAEQTYMQRLPQELQDMVTYYSNNPRLLMKLPKGHYITGIKTTGCGHGWGGLFYATQMLQQNYYLTRGIKLEDNNNVSFVMRLMEKKLKADGVVTTQTGRVKEVETQNEW